MTNSMTAFAVGIVLLFSAVCAGAEESGLMVSIAIPANESGDRWIVYKGSDDDFRQSATFPVVLTNVSDKPIRLWESWSSWGHDNLTFELTAKDGTKTSAQSARSTWFLDSASHYEIAPRESSIVYITFANSYHWNGFPIGATGSDETVQMKVRFKISPTKESIRKGVWTGSIESGTRKYRFLRDR